MGGSIKGQCEDSAGPCELPHMGTGGCRGTAHLGLESGTPAGQPHTGGDTPAGHTCSMDYPWRGRRWTSAAEVRQQQRW